MQMVNVHERDDMLESLVATLASFNGHRSVWMDDHGAVVHTEPDELLDDGWHYVTTVLHPTRESLSAALRPHRSTTHVAANDTGASPRPDESFAAARA